MNDPNKDPRQASMADSFGEPEPSEPEPEPNDEAVAALQRELAALDSKKSPHPIEVETEVDPREVVMVNLGRRIKYKVKPKGLLYNKFQRRLGRRVVFRGHAGRALERARRSAAEADALSSNSHEYARNLVALRKEARTERRTEAAKKIGLTHDQFVAELARMTSPDRRRGASRLERRTAKRAGHPERFGPNYK